MAIVEDFAGMKRKSQDDWFKALTLEEKEAAFMDLYRTKNEWQPIESAPKDGTYVLLYYPAWKREVWIGHYWITETLNYGKSTGRREAWYANGMASLFSTSKTEPQPTHWLPLPLPPEKKGPAE